VSAMELTDAKDVTLPSATTTAVAQAAADAATAVSGRTGALSVRNVEASYSGVAAVRVTNLDMAPRKITAIIGPSGCGKTTLIRTLNRMHEVTPGARVTGRVELDGHDLYGTNVDRVRVRRLIGMVFQRPNPFPTMSIFENVAAGVRLGGIKKTEPLADTVERSLRHAALWDEVKDRLKKRATSLSGGQQQRLCIARALAVDPRVLLMDEPCSALDPIATARIEDLMSRLKDDVTIVIVTHNMQQASRVSDSTAFFLMSDDGAGYLVEAGPTQQIFSAPRERLTEDYVSGRFG